MSKTKKPNYKLRRNIAKFIILLIIIIPIIYLNKVKILNLSLYLSNREYSDVIDAMFEVEYTKNEAENLLKTLKENKRIDDKTPDYILKFNSKGYNKNTTNYVLENLTNKQMTELLSKKYSKDFENYVLIKLFDYKKYNRYLAFQKSHPDLSLDDVVTRIELNLDKDFYEETEEEKDPYSLTCLVNKYRFLSKDFEPNDLVDMDDKYANNKYGSKKRIRKEAYEAFKEMVDAANKEDIKFYAESSYRTYKFQEEIYNSYLNNYGRDYANKYAAVPGYSEHQTGLSLDLANVWTLTKNSKEYKWVKKNAYKYGWVLRYEEDKVDITGFGAEEWHIRYVGKKVAKILHDKDLTLDEYYVKYIKKKSK